MGVGILDIESDYLPHVITCENGAADFAALQAQAVAARSYAYYKIDRGEAIADGTSDQVYSCAASPSAAAIAAVSSTAGEVLRYHDTQVAAFYVAGAIPSDANSCLAAATDDDYSSTEHFVTSNWGRAGSGLLQTTLGWVHEENWANRGCKSQNGAHCLAEAAWGYEDILLFYYGMDIVREQTEGVCAPPLELPHGCGDVVSEAAVHTIAVDDVCVIQGCVSEDGLKRRTRDDEDFLWSASHIERDCFSRWRFSVEEETELELQILLPDDVALPSTLRYTVRAKDTSYDVDVDTTLRGWVSLGTFSFPMGNLNYVELGDDQGDGFEVAFDAMRLALPGLLIEDGGVFDENDAGVFNDNDAGVLNNNDGLTDAGVESDLPPSVVSCACSTSGRPFLRGAGRGYFLLSVMGLFLAAGLSTEGMGDCHERFSKVL
ncbi:MAG: hypothetical protein GY822_15910 [Deltaproteobacteria bacterium]|nr:hypothetical protein [Deltaproteobacteria bacterium]